MAAYAPLIEAELALRLDEPEVAQKLYMEALERAATKDERAQALAGLGQIAFRAGKPREAIARFEEPPGGRRQPRPRLCDGRPDGALDRDLP